MPILIGIMLNDKRMDFGIALENIQLNSSRYRAI